MGCRVERDAPAGYARSAFGFPQNGFAGFRRLPLIEPYVQFSRIRLSVWKFVFIVPDPRILSESFHFGHDGIVQLGRAVYGSPHHLRIAPFDRPFGQYISRPHVLCLPFARRGPSLHGRYPSRRYYGLVRLLASFSRTRLHALRVRLAPKVPFELRSSVHSREVSRVPLLNFPDTRSSYAPPRFHRPSRFDGLLLAS